jgi:hypothetical protein
MRTQTVLTIPFFPNLDLVFSLLLNSKSIWEGICTESIVGPYVIIKRVTVIIHSIAVSFIGRVKDQFDLGGGSHNKSLIPHFNKKTTKTNKLMIKKSRK